VSGTRLLTDFAERPITQSFCAPGPARPEPGLPLPQSAVRKSGPLRTRLHRKQDGPRSKRRFRRPSLLSFDRCGLMSHDMGPDINGTQGASEPDTDRTRAGGLKPKPVCRLVGTDGNVFSIIGRVQRALKEAGQPERASEFVQRAFQAKSYDEVLGLCTVYVEVR